MTLTRDERDRFAATTPTDIAYAEGACLETPPSVFQRLHARFKFDVDLTANEQNHLCLNWFGPRPLGNLHNSFLDALTIPHWGMAFSDGSSFKVGFSNPPYGPFIPKILTKAIAERERGFTSVFLLPMRAAKWYQDLVIPYYSELWHCASRLTFLYQGAPRLNPKTNKPDGALFDSIIVVYKPYDRSTWELFPPPQRPNVWDPRTGELRY